MNWWGIESTGEEEFLMIPAGKDWEREDATVCGGEHAFVFEGTGERDVELICYMFSFRCSQRTYMGMYFDGFIVSKD